jgi:hypothetical protein
MQALDKDLRNTLEKTVKAARTIAELAANGALEQLGVGHDKPEAFLTDAEKTLRNRLRTHGKQLGDARDSKSTNPTYGKQEVQRLAQEVAYEHWHRMLFARFLADNNLLMYDGVAVTIEWCDELAADEGTKSGWELAGKLAARMLPQVFKPGSPVFLLTFAPEHQSELERLLKDLPNDVFKASDSLGWVYQFWQADNKERINRSEVKIGADELPAVTQLFTEPYMVAFLLHNSLGAWWVTRHPDIPCPVNLTYLRIVSSPSPSGEGEGWGEGGEIPAAGKFKGWPDTLAEFKLLDPCCGSGHFLVAAFLMLVPMRMAAEGLSAKEAINRVLADNLHGLELDPRCVEIAVFAVALEAWRYPDASGKPLGVREIPAPNIACCGLKVAAKSQDWEALVPDGAPNAAHLRQGLSRLHETFAQAPLLGSLLDPRKADTGDLFAADYRLLTDLLGKALATEYQPNLFNEEDDRWELALSAQGLLEAARLLDARYHLVITNVPYLGRRDQGDNLKAFCESHYDDAKSDLANVFLERCSELCLPQGCGIVQIVMPQNWLFLGSYKRMRARLLKDFEWLNLVVLGDKAFQTPLGVSPVLFSVGTGPNKTGKFTAISVAECQSTTEKSSSLATAELIHLETARQLSNPDARISLDHISDGVPLANYAECYQGVITGDKDRFVRAYWEVYEFHGFWEILATTNNGDSLYGGMESILYWQRGSGELHDYARENRHKLHDMHESGNRAWYRKGVKINPQGNLRGSPYCGEKYDGSVSIIVPKDDEHTLAIFAFCMSDLFGEGVRKLDKKRNVTNGTFLKVPFDLPYWKHFTTTNYPNGFPKPYSNDPTQWIFHGHPQPSTDPLQVAVARLLGYTWPAKTDEEMELSDEAREWIAHSQTLADHADEDGIVCIPPVGQESAASDRLLNLLAAAYGDAWSNDTLAQLLTAADHADKSLETWLREKFFTQHCKRFGNRPFVWHVWDGLRDGFAALVNYHKLDYKTLESLIYTYLGDWISRQKRDVANAVDGAQEKLAAAEVLKKRLELILEGEKPYDIFVRWKPLEEQPIGWNPDLNDGVRMNIRPFLSVPDVGKRGAGVLRDKPNIKWEKDRGADVASAPWYNLGPEYGGNKGDRINDHHLSLEEKQKARGTK